jgi:hypothetical protein
VLSYRVGDPDRPRGHALVFFRDADDPADIWATYLVVAPIAMDLAKYIPAAFAPQLAGQLVAGAPAAYPLPPVPERLEGGLAELDRLAALRDDDVLDGGTLRVGEPWQALHPVTDIGAQYAEACARYVASAPPAVEAEAAAEALPTSTDVDNLLLQVMPDREKVGRLARLTGTLRYAVGGQDAGLAQETVDEMERIARYLGDKYRVRELIVAARTEGEPAGRLAQLYVERCYKLVDEDYAALGELDRRIDEARAGRGS